MPDYQRYAIYFAPEAGSALGEFGNHWLGYDPESGEQAPHKLVRGLDLSQINRLTRTPARYGFHATLKPPFFLNQRDQFESLCQAAEELAGSQRAFPIPRLEVRRIGNFLALVPDGPLLALDQLAQSCVRDLDYFRKPPSDEELARRRKARLSPRQSALLDKWGYPYVMEEFRFHLTLTGRMGETEANRLQNILTTQLEDLLRETIQVSEIALFGDPGNQQPFRLLERFQLAR